MTTSFRPAILVLILATGACAARDPQADARAFVASADAYAARGEFSKAVIEYRNAIDRDEGVASTHYKLGLVYERTGDAGLALAAFVRAAQLDPAHVQAHLRAATALAARGTYVEAKRLAEAVIAVEPRNATAVALVAAAEAGLGNAAKSQRRLDEALALQPRFALAHQLVGAALLRRGLLKEARAALQTSVGEDAGSAPAWADLGQACWALGDLAAAGAAFERALGADAGSADVRRRMVAFYTATGRPAQAEPHLRALAGMSAEGRLVLSDYYLAAGRLDEAARELDLVTETHLAGVVRLRKAVLAHRRGDKAGAYRQLDAMLGDRATAPDATLVKADLLLQDGDVGSALRDAERSAVLRPAWPEASYMVAVIHLIRGDATAATRWLQRARADGADGPAIDLGLARAALMQGEFDRAITLSRSLVATTPSLQAYVLLARALRGKRDVAGARDVVARARVHWKEAPALDLEEGQLELDAGRPALARQAFVRALAGGAAANPARVGLLASMVAGGATAVAHHQVEAWLAADPGDIQALLLSARLDAMEGTWDAAERTLSAAQQKAPRDPDVAREQARVALGRGRAADAATHMARAADNVAHPVAELVALGMLREQAADVAGARTAYERALGLDPDAGIAANNLAWIYAADGRLPEALALAERAERVLGGMPQSLHTLGWMYLLRGETDRAIPWLRRAYEGAPDNPRYRRDLAQASARLGRPVSPPRAPG